MMIAYLSLLDPMGLYTTAISSWTVPLYIMIFSSATKYSLSVTLSDTTVNILTVTTTIPPPVESLFGSLPYVLGVLQIIFLRPSINFSVVPLSVSGAISLQLKANMHLRSTMIVRSLSTLPVQVMKKITKLVCYLLIVLHCSIDITHCPPFQTIIYVSLCLTIYFLPWLLHPVYVLKLKLSLFNTLLEVQYLADKV